MGLRRALGLRKHGTEPKDPLTEFHNDEYLRQNARVLEHLASLNLDLHKKSVLEVGAGIGDHTTFFLDRACTVRTTDGREANVEVMRRRFAERKNVEAAVLDLDNPPRQADTQFDIVYCYGVLYHLGNPQAAIDYMAKASRGLLLLETCVSFGTDAVLNPVDEEKRWPSQALHGTGCRPTRAWVVAALKKLFPHVYMPLTQPNHERFITDWAGTPPDLPLFRAVFIASRTPLDNPLLTTEIPMKQRRH